MKRRSLRYSIKVTSLDNGNTSSAFYLNAACLKAWLSISIPRVCFDHTSDILPFPKAIVSVIESIIWHFSKEEGIVSSILGISWLWAKIKKSSDSDLISSGYYYFISSSSTLYTDWSLYFTPCMKFPIHILVPLNLSPSSKNVLRYS